MARVAVVGAGIAGLSTAVSVQDLVPDASVTVLADRTMEQTTSWGAAGIFRPGFIGGMPGLDTHLLEGYLRTSWEFYSKLAESAEGPEAGASLLSGYCFSHKQDIFEQNPMYRSIVHSCRRVNQSELHLVAGPKPKHGVALTTVLVECKWHLPWLMRRFKRNGGKLEITTVKSLEELQGSYDVVVNCAGLRARDLVKDTSIIPARGQILKVHAPWIRHFVFVDESDTYIIPGREGLTVGGVRQMNDWNTEPRERDREDIWRRACEIQPSLKAGTVVSQWVGLRPQRFPVRVERDWLSGPAGPLKVVHNYGHGAHGISLGWGTGRVAAALVRDALKERHASRL